MNLRPGNPTAVQLQAANRMDRGQSLRNATVVAAGNATVDVMAVGSAMPMVDIPVTGNMPNVGDQVQLRYVDGRYTAFANTPNTPMTGTSGVVNLLTGTGGGGGGGGSAFPLAHAYTHAVGGSDALSPAAIGAATPAQITSAINAHLAAPNPHPQYLLATSVVVASGKVLTVNNSLTLSGTDGKSLTLNGSLTVGADLSLTGTAGKTLTVNSSIAFGGTDGKALTLGNSLTLQGTDGKVLTLNGSLSVNADTTILGGGTIGLGGFSFTIPASGTAVLTSRTINATAPITIGGGASADLSADRTIAISAATPSAAGSMSAADKTKLDQFTLTASKTFTFQNTLTFSGTDGKSLVLTGGLTVGADTTILGGGTIGLGGFSFTIPASSTAAMKNVDTNFSVGQTFGAGLTVSSGQNLAFAPDVTLTRLTTNVLGLGSGNSFQSTSFTSGLLGWQENAAGDAEFANVTVRGALRTGILLYNATLATAGTFGIFKSAARLRADVTVTSSPTYGTTTFNIDVDDADGLSHGSSQLFAVNDILRLKDGLTGDTWFKVSSVSDQTTFYRYVSIIMAGTNNCTYRKGLGVADYGVSGAGFILESADQANTPWIQMATHAAAFNHQDATGTLTITPQLRIGNLNGSYGYVADTYGMGAGQYGAASKEWITVDQTNGIRIGNNTTVLAQWDTSGNILVGQAAASQSNVYITSGGVQIRNNTTVLASWDSAGVITIGQVASSQNNVLISSGAFGIRNNTTERIGMTAAGILTIKDGGGNAVITLDASTGAQITKKLTLDGASSALAIGLTPPTSATAGEGIWMDRAGLSALNNSVVQARIDAVSGRIIAGGGVDMLSNTGIWVANQAVTPVDNALFIAPFDGSTTTDTGVTATTSGGVIYGTGKFAQAVQVAEATTNLVTNPSIEVNTTGYSVRNGSTLTRDTGQFLYGVASLKIVAVGVASGAYYIDDTNLAASTQYTFSVWMRGNAGSEQVRLGFFDSVGGHQFGSTIVLSTTWTRYIFTATFSTGTTRRVEIESVSSGPTWFADGWQVEAKAYATPYCDGSLGTGHAWTGSANASTSTRTAASISYNVSGNILPSAGTVAFWVLASANPAIISGGPLAFFFNANTTGASSLYFQRNTATNTVTFVLINDASTAYSVSSSALDWTVAHHILGLWDTNRLELYIDGVSVGTPVVSATMPTTLGTTMKVGLQANVAQRYANALIDDMLIASRAYTAAEAAALGTSTGPILMNSYAVFGVSAANSVPWGGLTLDKSDVLIGASPSYVLWDNSLTTLTVQGTINAGAGYFGSLTNGLSVGATGLTINGTGHITLADGTVQIDALGLYVQDLSSIQQIQLGNLTGIADTTAFPSGISGYGLYTKNAYIRGNIWSSGNIQAPGINNADDTFTTEFQVGMLRGGTSAPQGAYIRIFGRDHASYPGQIAYVADTRNASASSGWHVFQQWNGGSFLSNLSIDKTGLWAISAPGITETQIAATSGTPRALGIVPAAHTGLTASTEVMDIFFALARTVQFATGAKTTQRAFVVDGPTYSAVGSTTITDAATMAINAAPTASTNVTITRAYALWVQAGAVMIGTPSSSSLPVLQQGLHVYRTDIQPGIQVDNAFTSPGSGGGGLFFGNQSVIATAADHRFAMFGGGALNTSGTNRRTAGMSIWSSEAWTDSTAMGTHIRFETTAVGSGSRTEKVRITSKGALLVNKTASTATEAAGIIESSGGLGVNGAGAQAALASGGAAPAGGTGATAGAYDTAAHRDAAITLLNNIRTALVNCGIMS